MDLRRRRRHPAARARRRPRAWVAAVAGTLAPLVAGGAAPAAGPSVVRISASNFRFCVEAPCNASDQAYVRTDSGALVDNPGAFVTVRPGDQVRWSYEDSSCDSLTVPFATCPGHEIQFELGQPSARGTVGAMAARQGPQSLSWTVPDDVEAGTLIRYYCDLSDHWRLGVTGVLAVAG